MKKTVLSLLASCTSLFALAQAVYCDKVIGGYIADWEDAKDVNYNQLTHGYFAFIGSDNNGNLCTYENSGGSTVVAGKFEDRPEILDKWNKFLAGCNAAKVKKIISIGGYGCDAFMNAMASGGKASTFVSNLMAFVDKYQLDGVDLDWEDVAPEHTANYRTVYNALRTATTAKGKLLVCTVVMGWRAPNFPHAEMKSADLVQLMAYDQTATWDTAPAGNHSTVTHANTAISMWAGYGIAKSKLVLGVPFYGYQAKSSGGNKTKDWTYKAFVAAYPSAGPEVDNQTVAGGEVIGLNGQNTIKAKTAIGYDDIKGVMVWEMTQDLPYTNTKSLHLAIIQKMKEKCPSGHGNDTPNNIQDISGSTSSIYYNTQSHEVNVSIVGQSRVSVSLSNILGQELLNENLGVVNTGTYSVALSRLNLTSGVYLVSVNTNGTLSTSKIYIP